MTTTEAALRLILIAVGVTGTAVVLGWLWARLLRALGRDRPRNRSVWTDE